VNDIVELRGIFTGYKPKEGKRPQKFTLDCEGTDVVISDWGDLIPERIKDAPPEEVVMKVKAEKKINKQFTNFYFNSLEEYKPLTGKPKIEETDIISADKIKIKPKITPTDEEVDELVKDMHGWYEESFDFITKLLEKHHQADIDPEPFAAMIATVFIQRCRIESRRY